MKRYTLLPVGDSAVSLEFASVIDRTVSQRVLDWARDIEAAQIAGVIETVPTFRSLMVCYDPVVVSYNELAQALSRVEETDGEAKSSTRHWRIPVCYENEFALDLDDIARSASLTTREVVRRHCAETYHVYMLGFLPGQPYLGDLPRELDLPRKREPRARTPAGSVGIAGKMTCIFPRETPCGLNIIGRTPISFWDAGKSPESLLSPGDKVTFEPVSMNDYAALAREPGVWTSGGGRLEFYSENRP